jgi:ribosomal protein S18 acetylase RimI-like enzyme
VSILLGQGRPLEIHAADPKQDMEYILACGRNAWRAVYGSDQNYNPDFFRSNTESILRHRPDNVYIARICGNYAGIAILDSRVREEPATGHISLLYLEAPFRGSGYGTQLIAYAEAVCRGRGCRQMRLYVSKSNRRARRFYEKNGYRRFGAQFYPFSGQLVLRKPL